MNTQNSFNKSHHQWFPIFQLIDQKNIIKIAKSAPAEAKHV
jgi:hypothetical protein